MTLPETHTAMNQIPRHYRGWWWWLVAKPKDETEKETK
jgi:hypothetical protein